jgi:hypothetical protein
MAISAEQALEVRIQEAWDERNVAGVITYRAETLRTKKLTYAGLLLEIISNSSRDAYDRAPKMVEDRTMLCPFCEDSTLELARSADGFFRILGNRFACMRYQSILAASDHQEELDADFLRRSIQFALCHPRLTLLYNAPNAGRTVPHAAWLLSFHNYEGLTRYTGELSVAGRIGDLLVLRRERPAYTFEVELSPHPADANVFLLKLASRSAQRDFNIFLHAGRAFFIPRQSIETPNGFENHRFGGLEMIGCFVMKAGRDFLLAEPKRLVRGIAEISLHSTRQAHLESTLLESAGVET